MATKIHKKSANSSVAEAMKMMEKHPGLAEALLKQVLKHNPEHKAALELCGVIQHNLGKNEEAVVNFEKLTKLDPNYSDNWANLGSAYGGLGLYEKAIEVIEHAIRMEPKQSLYRNNLALQYRAIGRYEDAIKQLNTAINLGPSAELWDNLGGIYVEMQNYDEAIKCYKTSVKLNPKFIPAQINLSLAYHFNGDWKNGFKQYEWRFFYYQSLRGYLDVYDLKKMWDGKSNLKGKRVLVFGEQGYGDIIMFSRFLKDVKNLGAYVMFHVPQEMNTFFEGIEGVDEFVNCKITDYDCVLPNYDYHFPLMSAPYLLEINEINGSPYVKNINQVDFLKKEKFNVGIVWSGNAQNPDDKERSIPVQYFKLLSGIPDVELYSLQVDGSDIAQENEFIDLSKFITDFKSTANLIKCLDLVICCDTAVAHIAGAIGSPVWDLIRFGPDWRWGQREEKTHWYNSMIQFHQKERGNWEELFNRVKIKLEKTSRIKLGSD